MSVEKTLEEMGLKLPSVPAPVAAYVPGVLDGSLVYTSGQLPTENGALRKGKLGADMTVEEGYEAARTAVLNCQPGRQPGPGGTNRQGSGVCQQRPGF